jgi:hypothetical protein
VFYKPDGNTKLKFRDNEDDIQSEAMAIADRIVNNMRNNDWLLMMPGFQSNTSIPNLNNDWNAMKGCFDQTIRPALIGLFQFLLSSLTFTSCITTFDIANFISLLSGNPPSSNIINLSLDMDCLDSLIDNNFTSLQNSLGTSFQNSFNLQASCNPSFSNNLHLIPWGYNAYVSATGIAMAGEKITGNNYMLTTGNNEISADDLFLQWIWNQNASKHLSCPFFHNNGGNLSHTLTLAAIGNSWSRLPYGSTNNTQKTIFKLDKHYNDSTFFDRWDFYTLLQSFLHNETNTDIIQDSIKITIEDKLNKAPCEGAHSFATFYHSGAINFTDLNQFGDASPIANLNKWETVARPGIDFMLLYNLYCLVYKNKLPPYRNNIIMLNQPITGTTTISNYDLNISNTNFPITVPISSSIFIPGPQSMVLGNASNPLEIWGFNSFNMQNCVFSSASKVALRSVQNCKLSNINIVPGASFTLSQLKNEDQFFYCNGNNSNYTNWAREINEPIVENKLPSIKPTLMDFNLTTDVLQLNIVPNLIENTATINVNSAISETISISILNYQGKQIKQVYSGSIYNGLTSFTFDRSNNLSGLYLVMLKTSTGKVYTKKILIL